MADELLDALAYIYDADQPTPENGGFHESARDAARRASERILGLSAELDATRAKLAEAERERDELQRKGESLCWAQGNTLMKLAAREADVARLAARLREVLHVAGRGRSCAHAFGAPCELCDAQAALASTAQGDTSALRELLYKALAVQREASTLQFGVAFTEESIHAIVSRLLPEATTSAAKKGAEG